MSATAVRKKPKKSIHYSPRLATHILARIATGETLKKICDAPGMPDRVAVYQWVHENRDGLAELYSRARESHVYYLADEMLEIADNEAIDPQQKKHMLEQRRWHAERLLPRVFGAKQILSGDPENPIEVKVQQMSPEERLAEARKLLEAIGRIALLSAPTIDNEG